MTTYIASENLPILVKEQDRVIFELDGERVTYLVCDAYLSNEGGSNKKILQMLGLPDHSLTEPYGYRPYDGGWPEYTCYDYAAATRAIWFVQSEILKKQGKEILSREEMILPNTQMKKFIEDFIRIGGPTHIPAVLDILLGIHIPSEEMKRILETTHGI